jgi:RHS repeat-associated protein
VAGSSLAFTDRHDDVVGQFSATGTALSGSAAFDPWGTLTSTAGMKGSLGFQSGWTDAGTNQVNMLARWYDPSVGQFTSKDSLTLDPVPVPVPVPASASVEADQYAYVDDDPNSVINLC